MKAEKKWKAGKYHKANCQCAFCHPEKRKARKKREGFGTCWSWLWGKQNMGRKPKTETEETKPTKWEVRINEQVHTFESLERAREYAKRCIDCGLWFMSLGKA